MTVILFALSIFVAIWFGSVLIMKFIRGHTIPAFSIIVFAAAVTAIITKTIGMW